FSLPCGAAGRALTAAYRPAQRRGTPSGLGPDQRIPPVQVVAVADAGQHVRGEQAAGERTGAAADIERPPAARGNRVQDHLVVMEVMAPRLRRSCPPGPGRAQILGPASSLPTGGARELRSRARPPLPGARAP